jgi:hypothetical protein
MKNWVVIAVLSCFVSLPAFADVTNEVFVGFQADRTNKVIDTAGNDVTDTLKTRNSRFELQYTHFFAPLKDDEKPIELRRFYQHPSSLSIGLTAQGYSQQDSRVYIVAQETKSVVSMLLLGGELFLSTNTGFFLNVGAGSGKEEVTLALAGIDLPEMDVEVSRFDLGVRQYIGPEFMMQLRFQGETTKTTPSGFPETTSERGLVFFGVRGVIRDTLGLAAEIGGGERTDKTNGSDINYDVSMVNLEGDVYVGKELSFGLAIEGETQKRTTLPEHTTKRVRTTLSARYWFSEKVGLQIPFYAETTKDDSPPTLMGDAAETKSSGLGLYASFRF